jgi:hypothetical protein
VSTYQIAALGPNEVARRPADWMALLAGNGETSGPPQGVTRLPLDDGVRLEFGAPG